MLSERLRPNVECAPWVIGEVQSLESQLTESQAEVKALKTKLNALIRYTEHSEYCKGIRKRNQEKGWLPNNCCCSLDNLLTPPTTNKEE